MNERQTIEFWEHLCSEILAKYAESENWTPWLEKTFVDGTPIK